MNKKIIVLIIIGLLLNIAPLSTVGEESFNVETSNELKTIEDILGQ